MIAYEELLEKVLSGKIMEKNVDFLDFIFNL